MAWKAQGQNEIASLDCLSGFHKGFIHKVILNYSDGLYLLRDALKLWHSDKLHLSDKTLAALFFCWLNLYSFFLIYCRFASSGK